MTPQEIIDRLHLQPHPKEKGFFVETYRSSDRLARQQLPSRYTGDRCFCTAIYFLLISGGFSEMHRLKSDEIFHFYLGAPAEMLILFPDGSGKIIVLGNDLKNGQVPQIIVPHGCWQGMRTLGEYTLFGCTVAPGFEYDDYETGQRDPLIRQYPAFASWIEQLTL